MIIAVNIIEFLLYSTLFINTFLFIPQIIRILKIKAATGVSLVTFLGFLLIQLAGVVYGFINHYHLLMLSCLLSMMTCGVASIFAFFYRNQQPIIPGMGISFAEIIEQMPGNVYWKDKKSIGLGCNINNAREFGMKSVSEYIGKADYDLVPKEKADKVRQADIDTIKIGQLKIIEEEVVNTEGEPALYLSQKVPLRNRQNQIIGILGISFDITDTRKKEIDRLKLLENVIAFTPGHVYWKNKNGVILGCNDQQAKTLGFSSRQDVIGKTAYDLIEHNQPEEERRRQAAVVEENDRLVMEEGRIQTLEELLILPDGSTAIYMSNKAPLYNSDGEIIGMVGVSIDVTEQRKKAERELREVQHKLDGMTLVSATIAHELRTPLASLAISVDTLKILFPLLKQAYLFAFEKNAVPKDIDPSDLEEAGKGMDSMDREIRAAFTFIDMSLMNTMSIEHGKKELFLMSECIDDALERYPFNSNERNLVVWKKEAEQDFYVKSDKLLLIHVLFNLFKNAIYYIAEAQKGEISIWLEKGTTHNVLYFKDTGKGISPEILPHIFDQFFSRTYHGAGVGLTFCKNVMESIDGNITCESVEGSYTLFILTFPLTSLKGIKQ